MRAASSLRVVVLIFVAAATASPGRSSARGSSAAVDEQHGSAPPSAHPGKAPEATCSGLAPCAVCNAAAGCGYCQTDEDEGKCVSGNASGPADARACDPKYAQWLGGDASSCGAEFCEFIRGCSACVRVRNCAFCVEFSFCGCAGITCAEPGDKVDSNTSCAPYYTKSRTPSRSSNGTRTPSASVTPVRIPGAASGSLAVPLFAGIGGTAAALGAAALAYCCAYRSRRGAALATALASAISTALVPADQVMISSSRAAAEEPPGDGDRRALITGAGTGGAISYGSAGLEMKEPRALAQ